MTSWISASIPKKKIAPAPGSFFPLHGGTFTAKTKPATLVIAFYDLPSKETLDQRKAKVQSFLRDFPCPLVLFTEHSLADELALSRMGLEKMTRVVVLDPKEWTANTKFIPALWQQQVKQDPELQLARTVEEFAFGFEKKEFMKKAIELNPFSSDDFVWIDPSFLDSSPTYTEGFPTVNRIPTDRLLIANPEFFTADDIASSYFRGKHRISNSLVAGSKQAWTEVAKTIDVVLSQKLNLFAFIGDDLLVLHYAVIHKPNQFSLVNQPSLFPYLSSR